MQIRTRIAPSPTGIAHVGTLYTALLNFAFSQKNKGKFILRIEDTDRERYVPGSEQVVYSALRWAGIAYDEGPDIGGPFGPYTQSKRLKIYARYAEKLVEAGKAYRCFCSPERLSAMREVQEKMHKLSMYDRLCRKLTAKEMESRAKTGKHVIRLKAPAGGSTAWKDVIRGKITIENKTIDDQVILKSDGYPTYHLAVVVDDHLMHISHVIRAEEWISSTPKHILLYKALGFDLPVFAHTPLLRNPDRSKLSKRRNPVSVLWYREQGFLPEALINYLSLMGWSHPEGKEMFSLTEFVKLFSLERMQTSQPIFDVEKLRWLNGRYLREMADAELLKNLKAFLPKNAHADMVRRILPLVRDRIHTLGEFSAYSDFFFEPPGIEAEKILKESKHTAAETASKLGEVLKALDAQPEAKWKTGFLEKKGRTLLDDQWKARELFMAVRVAVTGKPVSPPLFESLEILGKNETMRRLEHAAQLLTLNV